MTKKKTPKESALINFVFSEFIENSDCREWMDQRDIDLANLNDECVLFEDEYFCCHLSFGPLHTGIYHLSFSRFLYILYFLFFYHVVQDGGGG